MAKKQRKLVEAGKAEIWKPTTAGQVLEGIYLGAKHMNSNKYQGGGFLGHAIQDEETGSVTYLTGAIADGFMTRLPVSNFVQVTFMGSLAGKNGVAKNYKFMIEEGTELLPEKFGADDSAADFDEDAPHPANAKERAESSRDKAEDAINF